MSRLKIFPIFFLHFFHTTKSRMFSFFVFFLRSRPSIKIHCDLEKSVLIQKWFFDFPGGGGEPSLEFYQERKWSIKPINQRTAYTKSWLVMRSPSYHAAPYFLRRLAEAKFRERKKKKLANGGIEPRTVTLSPPKRSGPLSIPFKNAICKSPISDRRHYIVLMENP